MKHYEKLLELGCFSKNDLEQITGSEAAAKWLCWEYQKKGYIERVKRDLYVAISLETQQPIANRYVIASHISNDAAVSYHSAFEFYGYSNQVFYETQVTSESRFRDFEYDGVTYRRIAPRITGGITEINGTRVTTLERTVIDSINLFEKIGGLEELLRCLALIPALDVVGDAFEKGSIFLPQLLQSATATQAAFEVIKTAIAASGSQGESKGRIVIATVKGDVHDIGKNIVRVILENYGYDVLDLGRDVPPERVVEAVRQTGAPLVGLSALMTTTVPNMQATIEALHAANLPCKVMVGGAVLTKAYAEQIGADFYAKDAKASADYAKQIFG